jgi:hypothetical protein
MFHAPLKSFDGEMFLSPNVSVIHQTENMAIRSSDQAEGENVETRSPEQTDNMAIWSSEQPRTRRYGLLTMSSMSTGGTLLNARVPGQHRQLLRRFLRPRCRVVPRIVPVIATSTTT